MTLSTRQSEGVRFHLQHIARLERLLAMPAYGHVDTESVDLVLEQAANFADQILTPLAEVADRRGCKIDSAGQIALPDGTANAYQTWRELGAPLIEVDPDVGGLGLPGTLHTAFHEFVDAVHIGFGMMPITQRGAARLALAHGQELPRSMIDKIVSGDWATTIAISEPQAGSDVGRILTRGVQDSDGTWRVSGTKCWISFGDHDLTEQIVHFLLARIANAGKGTRGLGLFAVGKHTMDSDGNLTGRNDVKALSIEHKMGLHGSPTCVMQFDNAEATLLGEPGKGLATMFTMVNCMRMGVVFQGVAAGVAATTHAQDYAIERRQGGRYDQSPLPIVDHIDVRRMLLEMEGIAETTRGLGYRIAAYLDLARMTAKDDERAEYGLVSDFLLPIAKTYATETGHDLACRAMQVFGGAGYTRDFPVERIARDVKVGTIFEGTSGIQAIDLVTRKLARNDGAAPRLLVDHVFRSLDGWDEHNPYRVAVPAVVQQFRRATEYLLERPRSDDALGGAYAYLQLGAALATGWVGGELYQAANPSRSNYQARLRPALSLYGQSLPLRSQHWADLVVTGASVFNVSSDLFNSG